MKKMDLAKRITNKEKRYTQSELARKSRSKILYKKVKKKKEYQVNLENVLLKFFELPSLCLSEFITNIQKVIPYKFIKIRDTSRKTQPSKT